MNPSGTPTPMAISMAATASFSVGQNLARIT